MNSGNKSIRLCHCNIIIDDDILTDANLEISNGKILSINKSGSNYPKNNCLEIDLNGYYIVPGFVDIHCHGGNGYDFMDGTQEAFDEISRFYAQEGITSVIATSMTADFCEISKFIKSYMDAKNKTFDGAEILGIHLEGPYLSKEMSGAQDRKYLKDKIDYNLISVLNLSNDILRMSLAPELPEAKKLVTELRKRNIIASIGHTAADYDIFNLAVSWGCSHVTHLYSGMKGVFYKDSFRKAGVVEAALLDDNITVELIADGKHLPSAIIELVYKIKGSRRIAIVSDAMRATGTCLHRSILGSIGKGKEVIIEDGVAKSLNGKSLAGSVTPLSKMVKFLYDNTSIPLIDIVRMVTATPADIMGLNDRGRIRKGLKADITILDKDMNVSMVIVGGRIVKNNIIFGYI